MKSILHLLASIFIQVVCLFVFLTPVFAAEQITSFDSRITIQQDTSIVITETIHYFTDETKHGIYRYIPIRYERNGLNYTTKVSNVVVKDLAGNEIPFSRSQESGNIVLKIGDPDTTFSGQKTYVLQYQVENAVAVVENSETKESAPELYWDITGEGWQVEIASASAVVESPFASIQKIACYAGAFGTDNGNCVGKIDSENRAHFEYEIPINYGDNMTVAVALDPNGQLVIPSKLAKTIRDNVALLPLFLPGLILFIWWWKKGRDREFLTWNVFDHDGSRVQRLAPMLSLRRAPFVYEPIKELTPGEAGAILDERVDIQDIIAEIIELARAKCLKIERVEKKKFLGKETDYILTKLENKKTKLLDHQQYLLDHLFNEKEQVKLSELKGTFYTHIEGMRQRIFQSLVDKELFAAHPQKVRGWAIFVVIALSIMAGAWGINLLQQEIWWSIPLYGLSIAVAIVCAVNMPAKTAKGHNFSWQAKGLQRSIRYGAWREKIKEKHLFIEEVLPFAIAFGVVKQLSKDMEALKMQPPEYLSAGSSLHAWNTANFVSAFASEATTNLTYNPSSSHSSSGSGFSGGFSGGGGGGGGGGSW